jgi:magnesium and cobalt transporter
MPDDPEPSADRPPSSSASASAPGPESRERPAGRGSLWRLLRHLRKPRNGEDLRDTIGELIEAADSEQEVIAPDERQLIRNILTLHDLSVEDVMVPRADIVSVEVGTPLTGLIELLSSETHSRLPVYRNTLDDIVGMVHIKDVLPYWNKRRNFKIETIVREVLFAAPSMGVLDLLAEMRDTRIHLALVVDEFGGIDGLVTIEDLVEEIVGEIEDEHDDTEAPSIVEQRPGVAIADARLTIEDFEERYGPILTVEEREDVDTLGGLVFHLANRVPARGELLRHSSGIEIEVLDADPRRVHRVRLRQLPARRTDAGDA